MQDEMRHFNVRINSEIFHSIWWSNGKAMTLYSYIYLVAALACIVAGNLTAGMIALVLAELNRVDKEARVLSCEQAAAIIYEGDHPEEFPEDKGDDDEQQ